MKLTKEQYDALPAAVKALFKKDGDDYVPAEKSGGDDDAGALKRALEREREERKELAKQLKELKDKQDADDHARNKDKGDIDAINASWQKKLDKAIADKDAVIKAREDSLRQLLVTSKAQELAGELSTAPHLLVPFIERRLAADFSEDGKAATRVLDKDGKLSALSLDELKKEMLADKAYASIMKASNASGGGASGGSGEGGAFDGKRYRNADGSTNWSKVNEDMKTNPEILKQVKAFNADPANAVQAAAQG